MNAHEIYLTGFEQRICYIIAKEREFVNEANNITEKKMSDMSAIKIHYQGVIGEFVVAKYLNIYPDFSTHSRSGGYELIYKGWKVDAKNSKYRNMMTPSYKKLDEADIYIAVSGENPYLLVGWCWGHQLLDKNNLVDKGHGLSYWLHESKLNPIILLWDIPRKYKA